MVGLTTAIDTTKPADGVPAVKSDLRANLEEIKTNIENLINKTITPQDFAQNTIGDGTLRLLSVDYVDNAAAKIAYPQIAAEIDDINDLTQISHDWAALQSMSNYAQINKTRVPKQEVPDGHYKITDTWKIIKGDSFRSFLVEGAGPGYGASIQATVIDATFFLDRPAISIQGARDTMLRDMCVRGGNSAPIAIEAGGGFFRKDIADYISPGVSTGVYNPYVGVAIDAYTVDPTGTGDPYPNDPYGRVASSAAAVENVRIEQFYLGLGVSLSNHGSNADQIIVSKCFLHYNGYQLSSGGTQNRMVAAVDCYSFGCHTISVNNKFGNQDGNCFSIYRMTAVRMYNIIEWTQSDPAILEHVHAEQFARIGDWNGGPLKLTLKIIAGHIKFFRDATGTQPADHMEIGGGSSVVFDGAHIQGYPGAPGNFNIQKTAGGRVIFGPGTNFYAPRFSGNILIAYDEALSQVSEFDGVATTTLGGASAQQALNDVHRYNTLVNSAGYMPDRVAAYWNTRLIHFGGVSYLYRPGSVNQGINVPGLSSPALASGQLTFDTTQPEVFLVDDWVAAYVISATTGSRHLVPVGRVLSKASNTITVDLECSQSEIDTNITRITLIQNIEWAPKVAPEATCSTSSADITFVSDVSDIIKANDWIQGDTGTWTNYRVVSVAGDGLTVTLNKNAPITGTAKVFWGRLELISGTPQ